MVNNQEIHGPRACVAAHPQKTNRTYLKEKSLGIGIYRGRLEPGLLGSRRPISNIPDPTSLMEPTDGFKNPRSTYLEILVLVPWLVGAKGIEHFFEKAWQPGEGSRCVNVYNDKQLIDTCCFGEFGGV